MRLTDEMKEMVGRLRPVTRFVGSAEHGAAAGKQRYIAMGRG
jgi:hypothetical protein